MNRLSAYIAIAEEVGLFGTPLSIDRDPSPRNKENSRWCSFCSLIVLMILALKKLTYSQITRTMKLSSIFFLIGSAIVWLISVLLGNLDFHTSNHEPNKKNTPGAVIDQPQNADEGKEIEFQNSDSSFEKD